MKRKAIMYLSMAIIFVILFGLLFLTRNAYRGTDRQQAIQSRVHTLEDFVSDVEADVDRAAYISGFRALLGVEDYLSQRGRFFENRSAMEEAFRQVFLHGDYNGTTMEIMQEASFEEYLWRIEEQASSIGLVVEVNVTNVTLEQVSPWVLHITFHGDFNISNADEQFWWEYQKDFATQVPIEGLKDPLYAVNTLGRVPVTVTRFTLPPTGYVNDTNNDTAVLKEFAEGHYYRASSEAPSFLQRFTNDLSASAQGIESLVYLPDLSDQGIEVHEDRSVADHVYFSENPDGSNDRCHIQGMQYSPDWFRLDQEHLDDYELAGLPSQPCS